MTDETEKLIKQLVKDAKRYRHIRSGNGNYYIARGRDGKAMHDPDTAIDKDIAEFSQSNCV